MNTSSRRLEDFLIQYCSPFDSNVVSEMILNNFTTSGVTLNHIAKDGDMFGGVQLDFIKTLAIYNSNLPSKLLLPSRVESLQLNNCAYDGVLDLKDTLIGHKNNTQHDPCYITLKNIAGLTKLTNINVGDNCLGIEISACGGLHGIKTLSTNPLTYLNIKHCINLDAMSKIDAHHISQAYFNNIDTFDKCNTLFDTLRLECSRVTSFNGIQNINVIKDLTVDFDFNNSATTNIINVLLTKAAFVKIMCNFRSVIGECTRIEKLCKLLQKFCGLLNYSTRSDYLMDCALDLIENGFEKEAEL